MSTRIVTLPHGPELTVAEFGERAAAKGGGILLLHGGAGPRMMAGFAEALAAEYGYVALPTNPGFDGTPRPGSFDSVADLATAYLDLVDALGLERVTVVGSSLGGWIAAEMAVRDSHRVIDSLVLVNAAGIVAGPGLEITDVSAMTPVEIGRLSFVDARFRPDPAAFTDEQRAVSAANQRTMAVYSGGPSLGDPKLRGRLHRVRVPVLVLWGEADGVIPLGYGRTFADSFPCARFVPVAGAGHFPFIEQPDTVFAALGDFVGVEPRAGLGAGGWE